MKLRALNSIKGIKPDDEYTLAGEVFELSDPEQALFLLDQGAVEEVTEEEATEEAAAADDSAQLELDQTAAAAGKAALIAAIAVAETVDALADIVPKDEADTDVLAALETRLAELEPNH